MHLRHVFFLLEGGGPPPQLRCLLTVYYLLMVYNYGHLLHVSVDVKTYQVIYIALQIYQPLLSLSKIPVNLY